MIKTSLPIKLCFLGCGNITKTHAKTIKGLSQKTELSFASRDLNKAKDYCKLFDGKHAFGDYNSAINSPEIDVIMINTPPHLHLELSLDALRHGKHIIVEKPPFFKSADFDKVGELAKQNNLQFLIAENYFYKPLRSKLENLLQQAIIGDPLFIQINATKLQESKHDWRENKELTGYGALFEGGIHWINFINNIGLQIDTVKGFLPGHQNALERSIQINASTKEGAVINLMYSWEVDTIFKGLRFSKILGRKGSIRFETNGVFIFVRGQKIKLDFGLKNITGFKPMFEDFFRSLLDGTSTQLTWQMAQKDLILIEDIYASIDR